MPNNNLTIYIKTRLMTDNNFDDYRKGSVLMQSALEKYAKGDFEGGNIDRQKANEFYDSAEMQTNAEVEKINSLYGESRNFGVIYRVIEENTKNLYNDREKRKAFKGIIKLLKEDKTLNTQFMVYNALKNPQNVDNVPSYVDEAFNLAKANLNEKKIRESNDKLLKAVQKANLFEYVDIDDDEMELYENVEYLLLHNVSFQTLNEWSAAKAKVRGYVTNHNLNEAKVDNSTMAFNTRLREIAEKYADGLTDDEMKLITKIYESKDKKSLFEQTKHEAINMLTEYAKTSPDADRDEVASIVEKINRKPYNEKTLVSDIAELTEISQIMNEE